MVFELCMIKKKKEEKMNNKIEIFKFVSSASECGRILGAFLTTV